MAFWDSYGGSGIRRLEKIEHLANNSYLFGLSDLALDIARDIKRGNGQSKIKEVKEMAWYWWIVIVCGGVYFICGIGLGIDWERDNLRSPKKLGLFLFSCLKVFLIGCFGVILLPALARWIDFQYGMDHMISG